MVTDSKMFFKCGPLNHTRLGLPVQASRTFEEVKSGLGLRRFSLFPSHSTERDWTRVPGNTDGEQYDEVYLYTRMAVALHCMTLHYSMFSYVMLHLSTHYIALRYIAIHYISVWSQTITRKQLLKLTAIDFLDSSVGFRSPPGQIVRCMKAGCNGPCWMIFTCCGYSLIATSSFALFFFFSVCLDPPLEQRPKTFMQKALLERSCELQLLTWTLTILCSLPPFRSFSTGEGFEAPDHVTFNVRQRSSGGFAGLSPTESGDFIMKNGDLARKISDMVDFNRQTSGIQPVHWRF